MVGGKQGVSKESTCGVHLHACTFLVVMPILMMPRKTTQAMKVGVFAAAGAAGEWPTHFDLHLVVGAWEYAGMVVGRQAVSQGNR